MTPIRLCNILLESPISRVHANATVSTSEIRTYYRRSTIAATIPPPQQTCYPGVKSQRATENFRDHQRQSSIVSGSHLSLTSRKTSRGDKRTLRTVASLFFRSKSLLRTQRKPLGLQARLSRQGLLFSSSICPPHSADDEPSSSSVPPGYETGAPDTTQSPTSPSRGQVFRAFHATPRCPRTREESHPRSAEARASAPGSVSA